MLCVRLGSAFDPSESAGEREGSPGLVFQVDSVSSAAFLVFSIFCIVGKEELPLVSWLHGHSERDGGSGDFSRFHILGFQPLRGRQRSRPCSLERAVFLVQGAIALLWFWSPHESKSQQSLSQPQQPTQIGHESSLHNAAAWLWSAAVLPFEAVDALGAACLARLAPPKPWVFPAPSWLLEILPAQLMAGKGVKLVPLLNVFLPWLVYLITAGIWLRLVLILCHMKKRENYLSTQQLRRAEAELVILGDELSSYCDPAGVSRRALQRGEVLFSLWRIEVWEYFSHYLFLTAVCPLCMYAMILGRAQLWPLLICCIKWRLLLYLSRVLVVPLPGAFGQTCKCCFCRATTTRFVDAATVSCTTGTESKKITNKPQHGGGQQFLLSNMSVCMLAALLALDTFFATGHRTKLSALPIEAGFVGLLDFHPVWSVVTSFLHTHIIYMICCPLIFMIAFLRLAHAAAAGDAHDTEELQGSTEDAVVQNTVLMVGKLAFG